MVFSSSATVYDPDQSSPLVETSKLGPINPYGRSKLMVEQIIDDVAASTSLRAINLRYFNPVGAHPSGTIGEDPDWAAQQSDAIHHAGGRWAMREEVQIFR